MHLSNLKLWNFRKFGKDGSFDIEKPDLNLDFNSGMNVLIGENDSGKTGIIDSIKLLLKTHSGEWIKVEEEDFFIGSEHLRIECTFLGMEDDEAKHFTEWLDWVTINGKSGPLLSVSLDVMRRDGKIIPADVKGGSYPTSHILTSEAKEMLKATYLRPLRDAKSELSPKRNSRLSQILYSHKAFKDKTSHKLMELALELNKGVTEYFKGKDSSGNDLPPELQLGKEIKEVMDSYLEQFSKRTTEFRMTSADLKNILESLSLLFQDAYNLGLGSHNLLCIASELLHLKKDDWNGVRLGLIEEIEAHLHPQVQMQVVDTLLSYSNDIQLIFTTHSPNIGSKIPLEQLILCSNGNVFPMGKGLTLLKEDDYKYLEIFLDTTKANLFFSRGVILVEGWAEEILVPEIANVIGINLTEYGVSVINVGSTAYLNFAKIFQRKRAPLMEIPVSVITDVDIRTYSKELVLGTDGTPTFTKKNRPTYDYILINSTTVNKETAEKIKRIDKSIGNVQYFIAQDWTLEYCLYKSSSMNTLFQECVKEIHTKTDWDTNFEKELSKKLINKSLDKVEIAYRLRNKVKNYLLTDPESRNPPLKNIKDALGTGDSIEYIIKAIKHATGN
ncbi:AAA family ATPase [Sphingobacterium sp.]|uniref:ATP-dependent nuclease n=1 Tax=Sphingobacterium sp. TaxID=341027 RepID=UPI0031E0CCEF